MLANPHLYRYFIGDLEYHIHIWQKYKQRIKKKTKYNHSKAQAELKERIMTSIIEYRKKWK